MPKVLFRVSYKVQDGKRPEYMQAITKIKAHYAKSDVSYSVYEVKGKHNQFQEVYIYPSVESYDLSDDPDTNTEIAPVIDKIYAIAQDVSYDVALETE